jgi:excisionase family DNA binding protein
VNLRAAAECLGVHYQTAYRWVRTGALVAVKQGASYEITPEEIERVVARRSRPMPPPRACQVRTWTPHRRRLHAALLTGDELVARTVVDRLRELGVDVVTITDELIAPVLHRIGEDWATSRVSVAAEHRASAICERLLARLAVHPRGRPRGVAVVTTPPGDEHGLASTMAAVALRADCWQVHHLGAGVPIPDLVALAVGVGADLVVVSVTFLQAKGEAEQLAEAVGATGRRVLVGEPGLSVRTLLREARRPGASRRARPARQPAGRWARGRASS